MTNEYQQTLNRVAELLRWIEPGNDAELRPGIVDTPKRVVASWEELFGGYYADLKELATLFDHTGAGSIILLKDIEFSSTCEHHMQPFLGSAHIAYIPEGGKVLGVSKLVRVLEAFARRLQIQERIGEQVVEWLMDAVPGCSGAACIIEAKHLCIGCRGVRKQNSVMVTSALRGVFMEEAATRAELMSMIRS
jgi:GTP cyclohydrolase I